MESDLSGVISLMSRPRWLRRHDSRPPLRGAPFERACTTLVPVTAPLAADALYHELMADESALASTGIRRVTRIGDCLAPGTIAPAVYGGHRYARELKGVSPDAMLYRRELVELAEDYAMP